MLLFRSNSIHVSSICKRPIFHVSALSPGKLAILVAFILSGPLFSVNQVRAAPLSDGVYRIPYENDTDIRVTRDHLTHSPARDRIDMVGINAGPLYSIVAAADGTIRFIEDSNDINCTSNEEVAPAKCADFNNYVWIEHANGEWTKYTHFVTDSVTVDAGLSEGDFVVAGTVLGFEGEIGFAFGEHLHFEVAIPDDPSDPIQVLGGFIIGSNRVPFICDIPGNIFVKGSTYTAADCGEPVQCDCTDPNAVIGTAGNDNLVGTPGEDIICGFEGNDNIIGGGDNDCIDGGQGNDSVRGGGGNDVILGGNGNNVLLGGGGNDHIIGEDGDDRISGGPGSDQLKGGRGANRIVGNSDDDVITGEDGDDQLAGGRGDDLIIGLDGNNKISGDSGDDRLLGGSGANQVTGGTGNDIITGGDGDGQLSGGPGNDEITGGNGSNTISGGSGDDVLTGGNSTDNIAGGTGNDTIKGGKGDDRLTGGSGNDDIDGEEDTDLCVAAPPGGAADIITNCE